MSFAAGQVLGGRYELVAPIGTGGMGTVWRARHRTLGRDVAVKLVRADLSDPTLAQRFEREAKIAAAIRHRNVVHIEDYGISETGAPYLAMELVDGQPFDEWLAREPRPDLGQIVEVVQAALAGLAAVHEAGFVHRDLKPANILVSRDADGWFPKLVDFGIARTTEKGLLAEDLQTLTHSGAVVGTPAYMSPEQIRGRDVDARADVFSAGVIVFEAIAGRRPFEGPTMVDLVLALVSQEAPALQSLRPDVPPALAAVVHRAISKEAVDRHADARALRDAIAAAMLDPQGTTTRTPPTTAVRDARRRRWAFVAIGVAAAAIGAVGVASLPGPTPAEDTAPAHAPPSTSAARPSSEVPVLPPDAPEECAVELVDLPAGAEVKLDGVVAAGPLLRMPQDGRSRTIEVSLAGHAPWRVEHLSRSDGSYRVALTPLRAAKVPGRVKKRGASGWVGEDF